MSLSLGSFCYAFWIVCFLLPSFYSQETDKTNLPWILNKQFIEAMLIVTAAINGAGAGILWVSQGKFISTCASESNKGFFNAFFWAMFMSSQIFGNVIAALLLGTGSKTVLFIVFSALACGGSLLFCVLRPPKKLQQQPETTNNFSNFDQENLESGTEEEQSRPIEEIKNTVLLLTDKRML